MKHLLLFLPFLMASCVTPRPTEVLVLSTIHKAHESNSNYTYEDLFSIIREYNPEFIGIEIRPEDIRESDSYLKNFYPKEMRMVKDSFPDRIVGLDFYGKEVQNSLMKPDVFQDSRTELGQYVLLRGKMSGDSLVSQRKEELGIPEILEKQKLLAMESSAEDFLKGDYDSLTRVYYSLLDDVLESTEYQQVRSFDRDRDIVITQNALALVESNPGKRILILVGANHRRRIVDSLNHKEGLEILKDLDFDN